jgi:hypothetical protein
MLIELPAYDTDQLPDESKSKELTRKAKAVFQWPPDCLWPFMDAAPGTDT